MAISSHEMYLILKVRDEGSRMLRAFGNEFSNISAKSMRAAQQQLMAGAALTTLGVAIGAAGIAGLMFFNNAVNSSMAYTQQAALTLTQVDKLGVSLENVKDIGRRVGNEVPVAFESIQKGLYDIFSSMNVTVPQAEMLLKSLSKAAVSGAVDVSVAARATIGILNAYKLPASDVNKVNDVMFQLVRKGIGTYAEFTATIGRSIPSAVKAGQSYQDVAGMLAFLTRNNMSAAMSSSAAARAMDALAKPKSIENLHKMGIEVADTHGKFRPMVTVMDELRAKLSVLTPVARALKLNELFKGSGGTIQAMRFFNLATSKSGPLLDQMTKAMRNSGGAAAAAYAIMSNTPQAKLELLNNRYKIMKTIVGDQLLPVKLKLIEALGKLLSWWNKLDPSMQKNIVKFLAIGSALMVLVGIILVVVGVILMMSAAMTMADIAFLPLIAVVGLVILVIGLLAVAGYEIITNWEKIKTSFIKLWNDILNWFSTTWDAIKTKALSTVDSIKSWLSTTWDTIKNKVMEVWNAIAGFFSTIWAAIVLVVTTYINIVKTVVTTVVQAILNTWNAVWGFFGPIVRAVWGLIVAIVNFGIAAVHFVIAWTMKGLSIIWQATWGVMSAFVISIWNKIFAYVSAKVTAIKTWIIAAWNYISSQTSATWGIIYNWISSKLSAIYSFVSSKIAAVKNFISDAWAAVKNITSTMWTAFTNLISGHIDTAMGKVGAIKGRVMGFLSNAGTWLLNAGENIIRGLANGITNGIKYVTGAINNVTGWIKAHLPGSPVREGPLRVLNNGYAGKQIVKMIAAGMSDMGPITKAMDNLGSVMITPTIAPAGIGGFDSYNGRKPGSAGGKSSASGEITQHFEINTQEIDPRKHAADLGFEIARRLGR